MRHEIAGPLVGAIVGAIATYAVGFLPQRNTVYTLRKENNELLVEAQSVSNKQADLENENKELKRQLQEKENMQSNFLENIHFVVDSAEIGTNYRGIVNNGELFLSTLALEDYFNKATNWDSSDNTIYVGDKSNKVAKEVALWNKPYLNVEKLKYFVTNEEKNSIGFCYEFSQGVKIDDLYLVENSITYALDNKAQKVSGLLVADIDEDFVQLQFLIFGDDDSTPLYTSPILTKIAPTAPFSVDTTNKLKIKIAIKALCPKNSIRDWGYIKDLTALSTDY